MNLEKKSYFSIVEFDNLDTLKRKMKYQNETIEDIKNLCDEWNVSLLQCSLAARNFEISRYLLENNTMVNHISKNKYNELHYLAAHLNKEGGIEIANELIDRNVDLNLKDKKYNNSAFWYLCFEVFKNPSDEGNKLLIKCLEKKPDILSCNIAGYSVLKLIEERGTNEIKKRLEI